MTDQPRLSEVEAALAGEIVVAENVSFEEFLTRFVDERVEWIDGKVVLLTMSNNKTHQVILSFLNTLFGLYLGATKLGEVFLAGLPMRLPNVKRTPVADLLVFLNEHLDRVQHTFVEGAADIVVEIVSPESEDRDTVKKLDEYARGGVPEYWLIDPVQSQATVYVLGDNRKYQPNPLDSQGRLQSRILPGFALHPDLLWKAQPTITPEIIQLVQRMTDSQP